MNKKLAFLLFPICIGLSSPSIQSSIQSQNVKDGPVTRDNIISRASISVDQGARNDLKSLRQYISSNAYEMSEKSPLSNVKAQYEDFSGY